MRQQSSTVRRTPSAVFELSRPRPGGGKALVVRGDAYLAQGARSSIIACHGFKGFARWGFWPHICASLREAGFNVVIFDFSGSGIGEDRETYGAPEEFACNTFTQEQEDLAAVVAYAEREGWLGRTFGLIGHSRGGAAALLYASHQERVRALVTMASVGDVSRWPEEVIAQWRAQGYVEVHNKRTGDVLRLDRTLLDECERLGSTTLNLERAASRIRIPWLIVHGTEDETVPYGDAGRLYAAAGEEAADLVQLELIPGANHTFGAVHPLGEISLDLAKVTGMAVEFFTRRLW